MSFSLKDQIYHPAYVHALAGALQQVDPRISATAFAEKALNESWEGLALKERMRHLTQCLHHFLPQGYAKAIDLLKEVIEDLAEHNFANLIFPDYVEQYGLEDLDLSLDALEFFTLYGSSEFGVRPFIKQYEQVTMQRMRQWAEHENHHLRRLASEGCRPRLPWGMALSKFMEDPTPILPILERLKADPEDYVYRSVANNLNDISKDHPHLVLDIAERWHGVHPHTDWAVKHGLRTLLKRGNPRAMQLFGFGNPHKMKVETLELNLPLSIGEELHFSFSLHLPEKAKVRLEYAVDYLKKRGTYSRKVFKISEKEIGAGTHTIHKKQWFKDFSTRKHYPGEHFLSIIVNGVELIRTSFELQA
ncbi:MAG TPA: DNA alkylation repair protein [Saprospiraceae bacterium]|nr:DNA alkylation repair protein [Saprospiraceae bacterium]